MGATPITLPDRSDRRQLGEAAASRRPGYEDYEQIVVNDDPISISLTPTDGPQTGRGRSTPAPRAAPAAPRAGPAGQQAAPPPRAQAGRRQARRRRRRAYPQRDRVARRPSRESSDDHPSERCSVDTGSPSSSRRSTRPTRSRRRSARCRASSTTSSSSTTAAATPRRPIARRAARRAAGRGGTAQVEVIVHAQNRGVGAAIAHRLRARARARRRRDGGDGGRRSDGSGRSARACSTPVVDGAADYAKGNRFAWPGGWRQMPPVRLRGQRRAVAGSRALASGYWHLFDSQCGYTVASRRALAAIGPERMFARYGYPERSAGAAAARRARASSTCRCGRSTVQPGVRACVRRVSRCRSPGSCCARSSVACAPGSSGTAAVGTAAGAGVEASPLEAQEAAVSIGLLTTSFPRHAGDYAGSFVGDRVQRLLADGHAGRGAGGAAAAAAMAPAVDGRRIVSRACRPPFAACAAALLRRGRARGARARRRAVWLAAARFSAALAAAARRARATLGRDRIALAGPERRWPRSPRRRPSRAAPSLTRATWRCWNGSRSGARSRAGSRATGPSSAS